jgi:hypothetical protein
VNRGITRIFQVFVLLILVFTLSSWAAMLSPAPKLEPLPAWLDGVLSKVGWTLGTVTFVFICFTKPGHRFLVENSQGKLWKQFQFLIGPALVVGFMALVTVHGAVAGLGGLYVSLRGESATVLGEIVAKSYTDSRGCRYRTDIRWLSDGSTKKICYSEELWTQLSIGQEVAQERWQFGKLHAVSDFVWPTRELQADVKKSEVKNKWRGFVFLGAIFFIPVIGGLLIAFFSRSKV